MCCEFKRYAVHVGNIGRVHETDNLQDARFCARGYVEQSKSGRGRAAGETVVVVDNTTGEIMDEYAGRYGRHS